MQPSPSSFDENAAHYLIGIDVGSSSLKACAFGLDGSVKAIVRRTLATNNNESGSSERDAAQAWQNTASALRELTAAIEGRPLALAVTGCGNGAVFVNSSLDPILPGILSTDRRAEALVECDSQQLQHRYAGQGIALLNWFRSTAPKSQDELAWILGWKDFVRARLIGAAATDPTDAGAAGFLDIITQQYFLDDPALPPILQSTAIAGRVTPEAARETGLPSGLPVAVGCVDFEAAAIGTGVNDTSTLSIVAGSWSINQAYVKSNSPLTDLFLCNSSTQNGDLLVLEGSPNSANHFDWFCQATFDDVSFQEVADDAEKSTDEDIVFMPGLFDRGAAFFGLKAHHGRNDMAKAVMRGVCFAHRRHIERLRAGGMQFDRAKLAGGAAASRFWSQMFADTLSLPVERPAVAEPGAMGAAILAGIATGIWPDIATAQDAMVPDGDIVLPRADQSDKYEAFTRISELVQ